MLTEPRTPTMRTSAFRRVTGLLAVLTLAIASQVAPASAQSDRMLVHVPFAFVAGKASLPAGDYLVTRRGSSLVELRATETDASALVTTAPLDVETAGERRSVTFDREGGKLVLASVQAADGTMQVTGIGSKGDGRLAREGAAPQVVVLAIR